VSAILAQLTGEERKPLRAACRAGRYAVDAGVTRRRLIQLSGWGGGLGAALWASMPLKAVRLPALRHLDLQEESATCSGWAQRGAAHMRGAARQVAAHAASLRTLRLEFWITSPPTSHHELAALEVGFLESVLLAAPLPALRRLDLSAWFDPYATNKARCLEALRPLVNLSLPRLARLSLDAGEAAGGQGVRLLEGAHLPALHHLKVEEFKDRYYEIEHPCALALAAPRWSVLEALDLDLFGKSCDGLAALSAALAPTLRRLVVDTWQFGTEGCAEEWPQLRSLEFCPNLRRFYARGSLAQALRRLRLPRLERATHPEHPK
jgi:hypothetical protein